MTSRLLRTLGTALVGAMFLAACGSDKPKPVALESLTPKIAGRVVWQAKVDGARFALSVAGQGDRFIAAGDDGTVLALDAASGRELWRASAGGRISAGVGSDGRWSAVVTQANEVVVFDGAQVSWRARLPARTVTAPLVAGERVFVMTVDRTVHAFDAVDGRRLWVLQRPGEALTLGQAGLLTSYRDTLIVGQGPRLAGVDPLKGAVRWEVPIASPRGTNEVERLADLIGPPVRIGRFFCARSFQAAVGCVDADRGALQWARNVGGIQAVGGDDKVIVGADASDRISAWRFAGGEPAWTNEKFLHRATSGFVSVGKTVVFGDGDGFVHFLDRDSGDAVLRLATDGTPVVGTPALAGTTMLVVTRGGGLFALRPE